MKILLVEDDRKISEFIKTGLIEEGFSVDAVHDGEAAIMCAQTYSFDLMILDLMIPKVDGLTVLTTLKRGGFAAPILILSAKQSVEDKVSGLDSGADDYLVKPFSFAELIARIHVLLRRKGDSAPMNSLEFNGLSIDRLSRKVFCDGKRVDLQMKEFALLELFLKNKERILSKTYILDQIWNIDFDPQTNVVDVLVCRLRNKIERVSERKYIQTIRGSGYVLKNEE